MKLWRIDLPSNVPEVPLLTTAARSILPQKTWKGKGCLIASCHDNNIDHVRSSHVEHVRKRRVFSMLHFFGIGGGLVLYLFWSIVWWSCGKHKSCPEAITGLLSPLTVFHSCLAWINCINMLGMCVATPAVNPAGVCTCMYVCASVCVCVRPVSNFLLIPCCFHGFNRWWNPVVSMDLKGCRFARGVWGGWGVGVGTWPCAPIGPRFSALH